MTANAKSRRQFTLLTLVAALGVAVYLNWEYAKTGSPLLEETETVTDGVTVSVGAEDQTQRRRQTVCGI